VNRDPRPRPRGISIVLLLGLVLGGAPAAHSAEPRHTPAAQTAQTPARPQRHADHETTERRQTTSRVHLIVVDGGINPATADFIHESIVTAEHQGVQALIIELDTPGGLLESTKVIVKDLLGAPLPVIVYVAPSGAGAASAGHTTARGRPTTRK